jgi:hypothetical protein
LKLGLYKSVVQYIPIDCEFHDNFLYNKSYYPYFKDYIKAIDSTKILISPPTEKQVPFRDKKSNLTQNILVICDFDMKFTDILVSWEGSTVDLVL